LTLYVKLSNERTKGFDGGIELQAWPSSRT
jgi:hypothetical protein